MGANRVYNTQETSSIGIDTAIIIGIMHFKKSLFIFFWGFSESHGLATKVGDELMSLRRGLALANPRGDSAPCARSRSAAQVSNCELGVVSL